MPPISKVQTRRTAARLAALKALQELVDGRADRYEIYRTLYTLWCNNNAALQELKPLFRIPGVDPDGSFAVNAEFRHQVSSLAQKILPQLLIPTTKQR